MHGYSKLRTQQSCCVTSSVLPASVIICKNCLSNDATGMKGLGRHNQCYFGEFSEMWELFATTDKTLNYQEGMCNLNYTNPWSRGLGFWMALPPSDLKSTGPGGWAHPEPMPFRLEHVPGGGTTEFSAQGAPGLPPSSTLATSPGPSQTTPSGMHPKVSKEQLFAELWTDMQAEYPPSYVGLRGQDRARDGKRRDGWPGSQLSPALPPPALAQIPRGLRNVLNVAFWVVIKVSLSRVENAFYAAV